MFSRALPSPLSMPREPKIELRSRLADAGTFMAGQYCQLLGSAPTSLDDLIYALQFQGDYDPYNGGVTINILSFPLGLGGSLPSVTFDFADGRR